MLLVQQLQRTTESSNAGVRGAKLDASALVPITGTGNGTRNTRTVSQQILIPARWPHDVREKKTVHLCVELNGFTEEHLKYSRKAYLPLVPSLGTQEHVPLRFHPLHLGLKWFTRSRPAGDPPLSPAGAARA